MNAWKQRLLIETCKDTLSAASGAGDGMELIAEHIQRSSRILECETGGDTVTLSEAIEQHEELERSPKRFIATGIRDLAKQLQGGLKPSQLVIVGARPSCGKSVLGAQICRSVSEDGGGSLLVSLEMEAHEIAGRYLTYERSKPEPAISALKTLPMLIVDSTFSVDRVVSVIRRESRRNTLRVVIIDYLQLMEPSDRSAVREQQVAAMSRRLKLLAGELRVPILLLCQLNRQCVTENRAPRLSDLRESGSIEQDADTVLLLHRPDMTDPQNEQGKLFINVAKQRGGPTGMVTTVFRKEVQRIEDAVIYEGSL